MFIHKIIQDIKTNIMTRMHVLITYITQSNNEKFIHEKSPMIYSWGYKDKTFEFISLQQQRLEQERQQEQQQL